MLNGIDNNDSFSSNLLTICSALINRVPKRPLVAVVTALTAGIAIVAIKPDTLLTKIVTVAGTSAVAGYAIHRIHDFAAKRVLRKIIAPGMLKINAVMQNFYEAVLKDDEEGAVAAAEELKNLSL